MPERWTHITATQNDDAFFEDFVRLAIACEPAKLPERTMRLGAVQAGWFPTVPGTAHIFASGGTPLDRRYAYVIIANQLDGHGIKPASYSLDWDYADETLIKEAGWPDIQAKATRLIKTGKVKITCNSKEIVTGVVEGDHGTYNTEIQRNDPNSQAIAMWSCECKWDQFAWQRCVARGTKVTLSDGTDRNVEDIKVGDCIIDHVGKLGEITETHGEQWKEYAVTLTTVGFEPLTVKPNHPVFAVKRDDVVCRNKDGSILKKGGKRGPWYGVCHPDCSCRNPRTKLIEPRFYLAEELEEGDFLVRPHLTGVQDLPVIDAVVLPLKNRPVKINEDFMRLIGYYLAEGGVAKTSVRFSFHKKEQEYLEDIEDLAFTIFGNEVKRETNGPNCENVAMNNREISEFFLDLVGTGHTNKKLPRFLLHLDPKLQAALIEGWHRGDGHIRKGDGRYSITTVSTDLAHQLEFLLQRQGFTVGLVHERRSEREGSNEQDAYTVYWKPTGRHKRGVRFSEDARTLVKITKADRKPFDGEMIDLSVSNNPGFLANGFGVHNTRQWKRLEGRVCSHVLATYWQSLGTPLDEDIGPGSEAPPEPQAGGAEGAPAPSEGAPQPSAVPGMEQVPGGGTGMVPPAGTPGPQKPGLPNQIAPTPEPAGAVPGQAPEPQSLIPQYPHDPALQPAINPVSVPGQKPQTPLNPLQNPGGTFSRVYQGAETFVNGQMVQLKQEDVGQTVGLNGGQTATIPANSIGEVLGVDPLGLVNVYFAGPQAEAGRMEPHGITSWHWGKDLISRPDIKPPGPATRRR
jgi:LAGLIDADG-like domain